MAYEELVAFRGVAGAADVLSKEPRKCWDDNYYCPECRTTEGLNVTRDDKPSKLSDNRGGDSSYYEIPAGCNTIQDIIYASGMTWNQANIFKSVYRWDKKPDLEYNLNKIKWFAQDELDRLYNRDPNNPRSSNYERELCDRED